MLGMLCFGMDKLYSLTDKQFVLIEPILQEDRDARGRKPKIADRHALECALCMWTILGGCSSLFCHQDSQATISTPPNLPDKPLSIRRKRSLATKDTLDALRGQIEGAGLESIYRQTERKQAGIYKVRQEGYPFCRVYTLGGNQSLA